MKGGARGQGQGAGRRVPWGGASAGDSSASDGGPCFRTLGRPDFRRPDITA